MALERAGKPQSGDRIVTLKNKNTGMRIRLLIKARRKVRKNGPLMPGRRLVGTNRERIRGMQRNIA